MEVLFLFVPAIIFGFLLYLRSHWLKEKIMANYNPNEEVLNPNGHMRIFTMNSLGLDKFGKYRRNGGTYVTYQCITAIGMPLLPIGAYRIEELEGTKYKVYGSVKSNALEILHFYIGYYGWVIIILSSVFSVIGTYSYLTGNW